MSPALIATNAAAGLWCSSPPIATARCVAGCSSPPSSSPSYHSVGPGDHRHGADDPLRPRTGAPARARYGFLGGVRRESSTATARARSCARGEYLLTPWAACSSWVSAQASWPRTKLSVGEAALQRVDCELQRRRDVVAEAGVVLADLRDCLAPTLDVDGEQFGEVVVADAETSVVSRAPAAGSKPMAVSTAGMAPSTRFEDPLQHAHVLAEPRPQEPADLAAEPVDKEQSGRLAGSLVLLIDSQWSK